MRDEGTISSARLQTGSISAGLESLEPSAAAIDAACARWVPDPRLQPACGELLSILVAAAGADRGSILVLDSESKSLGVVASVGLPAEALGREGAPRPRSISHWVIRERRGLILNGEVHSQHFEGSAGRDQIGSALSVPLLASYGPVGVLNLARFVSGSRFTGNEFTRVERLAAPVAAAVERLQRTRLAHEIYYQLVAAESGPASAQVPRGASEIHNYQIAFAHRSSRGLDGDLCDRVSHPNAVHSLLFIDVAGSGPPAAASAAFFQGLFVAGASAKRSAAGLMAHLNKEYLPRSGVRPAAAVWIAQLSPTGGLTSCSAGTVAPMWVAADGSHLVRFGRGGPVLGASASGRYVEESVRLLPGDTVVAVSDGVIAAQDNSAEAFGQGRLEELLVSLRRQPLDRVADAVCEAALGHCGWPLPAEDLTVLALRFTPGN